MVNRLQEIIDYKRAQVAAESKQNSIARLQATELYQKCVKSLHQSIQPKQAFVIAEFKRKSPAKGILKADAKLDQTISAYQAAGAAAISVLSDQHFFAGSNEDIIEASTLLKVPLLRKEFIIDQFQVYQTKSLGADLILLIAAVLDPSHLNDLAALAVSLGLEVLLEIHDPQELQGINLKNITFLGVNNRNLETFQTNPQHSQIIAKDLPPEIIKISESGINSPTIAKSLFAFGYQGYLIGEYFMREENPGLACQNF